MPGTLLRLLIVAWVLVTLVRAGATAWRQRRLVVAVWRRVRLRHLVGCLALLVVVATVAEVLIRTVPGMGWGLGELLGFTGNAVFAPLEEAVSRSGPPPATGPDWTLIGLTSGFLLPLLVMLPWLAFVEEEVFRAGLEDAALPRQLAAATVFGLAHLVMLVPVGAALAVGVAGFVYGSVYRRAYADVGPGKVPEVALRVFRPTRRSAAAAHRARLAVPVHAPTAASDVGSTPAEPSAEPSPERRQAAAVLASTVWHTTFNSMIVVLLWVVIVLGALEG